jgi:hypothetical protein
MATNKPQPLGGKFAFIDNPQSPVVYADAVTGIASLMGNIRLTFEVARVNHVTTPGPVTRVVIGTLVIPMGTAGALRDLLTDYLRNLEQGHQEPMQAPPTLQ